jgi:hypothetical protein
LKWFPLFPSLLRLSLFIFSFSLITCIGEFKEKIQNILQGTLKGINIKSYLRAEWQTVRLVVVVVVVGGGGGVGVVAFSFALPCD